MNASSVLIFLWYIFCCWISNAQNLLKELLLLGEQRFAAALQKLTVVIGQVRRKRPSFFYHLLFCAVCPKPCHHGKEICSASITCSKTRAVVTIMLNWVPKPPKWLLYVWLKKEKKETSLIKTLTPSKKSEKQWRDCRNFKVSKKILCGFPFSLKIGKQQMDNQQNPHHLLEIRPGVWACKALG